MPETIWQRKEDLPFEKPNCNRNVWPHQSCPAFGPRSTVHIRECWFCRHADFHLEWEAPLDVGICFWPKDVTGIRRDD